MNPLVRAVPTIVDAAAAQALGILPLTLKQYLQQLACADTPLSAVMGHEAISVAPEMSAESVTAFLIEWGLPAVTVVDDRGALVGTVSIADLLRETQDRHDGEDAPELEAGLEPGFHVEPARTTVRHVMNASQLAMPDTASVAEAAALMSFEGRSHLAVACSKCGGYCVVSALDVVSWLANQSGASPLRELPH